LWSENATRLKETGNLYIILIIYIIIYNKWTAVEQWLRYFATNQKVAGSIPGGVMEFFIDINPSDRTMIPGIDSASNRNEYQEYFLGVNAAVA
jgi:hypothetical protein